MMRWNSRRFHYHIVRQFRHLYHLVLWISWLLVSANNETDHDAGGEGDQDDADNSANNSGNWNVTFARLAILLNV